MLYYLGEIKLFVYYYCLFCFLRIIKYNILSQELQDILRNSKDGVIYVNLGSTITEELPKEVIEQLIKVFRHLEQDIVWKYGDKLEHMPANVHVMEWVPEQALLSKLIFCSPL